MSSSTSRYKPLPPTPNKALPSTPPSPIRRLLPILISVLLITTVFALSWHYLFPSSEGQPLFSSPGGRREGLQPDLPLIQTTFNHPTPYSEPPPAGDGNEDLDPWERFLDGEGGLVEVEDRGKYGLPEGFGDEENRGKDTYRVAAWTQLRCLALIRKSHHALPQQPNASSPPPNLSPHVPFIQDCFDYLRQSIQCAADTTLEFPVAGADGIRNRDGWGVEHTCKSWKGVEDWMGGISVSRDRKGLGGLEIGVGRMGER